MCGRYTLICIDDLGRRFRIIDPTLGLRSRFNVAPSDLMPVIIRRGSNEMVTMYWGLDPRAPGNLHGPALLINARAETLAEQPEFRDLLATNRCLVPASGFYEWKSEGRRKTPFYFHLRNEPVFAFAGLWDVRKDSAGDAHLCYTIITTRANDLVAPVHSRMPVILKREDEERWIGGAALSRDDMAAVLAPGREHRMEMYPVSPEVNNPSTPDDERLIRPIPTLQDP